MEMTNQTYKACPQCNRPAALEAQFCQWCGHQFRTQFTAGAHQTQAFHSPYPYAPHTQTPVQQAAGGNKIAAGICAILLGCLGVHKFILGLTTPGIVMLLVTLLTFGLGAVVMAVIGIAEGIIYLTKSDAEFYQIYMVDKKAWF
jgi:TM2 domain-containing membrane protein YozV